MIIRQATTADLSQLAEAFDQYRIFYQQASDVPGARAFLQQRLEQNESVVFMALENEELTGFTQLYPSFTSVGMDRIWILNDLYVREAHRRKGVAQALLQTAADFARQTGRKKLVLSTGYDNHTAQRLYEHFGFIKEEYYNYELDVRENKL